MREENIRTAIIGMSGDKFELFVRELVRRELYPGLNPTSPSYDLGEDARTESSTVFMHNGLWVSLSISKTTTFTKIKGDCETCRKTGRRIDVIVFVTDEDVRTDIEEQWRNEIRTEFGWALELRTLRWLAPVASQPQYESLVDDYLAVPPPSGDYLTSILEQFKLHTQRALQEINRHIPGIPDPLHRREVETIEEQLTMGRLVVITGEAGTGKSGLCAIIAANALGKVVLLIDSRRVGLLQTEMDLRGFFGLNGPLHSAIHRAGHHVGCRLIIDQLDNIIGSPASDLLVNLVVECCQIISPVEIVIPRCKVARCFQQN